VRQELCCSLRRDHLAPIIRIARADLPHTSDFKLLRMRAGKPTTDQLVSAAIAMTRTAKLHTATFVAAGMHPTLLDELHAAMRALQDRRLTAIAARGRRRTATSGIDAPVAEGHHISGHS
jgi:hypothetical protein